MRRRGRLVAACVLSVTACRGRDAGVVQKNAASSVRPTPAAPERFVSIGRAATAAEIRAWDIDVNPSGEGLPPGRGTYDAGTTLFAKRCAVCHGAKGEGLGPYPKLIGGPTDAFNFASDAKIPKTIGNYWPYATTLYDYIRRAMPLTAPGSLTPDEIYSVAAFLLAENGIVGKTMVIDARTLPRVQMPARAHFVVDDRKGGPGFR